MNRPKLVLVNGLPGTGKTTVARKISDHFHWPCFSKDVFKELIFDGLGWSDKAWSFGNSPFQLHGEGRVIMRETQDELSRESLETSIGTGTVGLATPADVENVIASRDNAAR